MFKATFFGAVLTWCISVVVGSQGSSGGVLAIETFTVFDFKTHFSWPLLLATSGLCWGLILLQD